MSSTPSVRQPDNACRRAVAGTAGASSFTGTARLVRRTARRTPPKAGQDRAASVARAGVGRSRLRLVTAHQRRCRPPGNSLGCSCSLRFCCKRWIGASEALWSGVFRHGLRSAPATKAPCACRSRPATVACLAHGANASRRSRHCPLRAFPRRRSCEPWPDQPFESGGGPAPRMLLRYLRCRSFEKRHSSPARFISRTARGRSVANLPLMSAHLITHVKTCPSMQPDMTTHSRDPRAAGGKADCSASRALRPIQRGYVEQPVQLLASSRPARSRPLAVEGSGAGAPHSRRLDARNSKDTTLPHFGIDWDREQVARTRPKQQDLRCLGARGRSTDGSPRIYAQRRQPAPIARSVARPLCVRPKATRRVQLPPREEYEALNVGTGHPDGRPGRSVERYPGELGGGGHASQGVRAGFAMPCAGCAAATSAWQSRATAGLYGSGDERLEQVVHWLDERPRAKTRVTRLRRRWQQPPEFADQYQVFIGIGGKQHYLWRAASTRTATSPRHPGARAGATRRRPSGSSGKLLSRPANTRRRVMRDLTSSRATALPNAIILPHV